jgi:glycosyltransferase involved in cell wall biosynthesis
MSIQRVLILQAMCKQYRAPLYAHMYKELSANGIELRVAYSHPPEDHQRRNDDVDLPAEYGIKIPQHSWFGDRLFLQLPIELIRRADLVIVEHAVKHLINYPLTLLSRLRLKKLGFWVHGGTLRHASSPWLRPWRVWSMLAASWVFSYTKGVASTAIALGAQPERVTTLQNAIDLSGFRKALAAVSAKDMASAREQLGLSPDAHIALFCGSLYPGRGVEFLVAAGDEIARRDPSFHLIAIGGGPLQAELAREAKERPWLRTLGSIFGEQRAVYFRLSQVCVMPYLAGLGILDAMAAGLPFLVTGARATNPEIDYLIDGVTGLVTGDSVKQFADAVAGLLNDPARLESMSQAALTASYEYSIENMASNFCCGIRACLAQPSHW